MHGLVTQKHNLDFASAFVALVDSLFPSSEQARLICDEESKASVAQLHDTVTRLENKAALQGQGASANIGCLALSSLEMIRPKFVLLYLV